MSSKKASPPMGQRSIASFFGAPKPAASKPAVPAKEPAAKPAKSPAKSPAAKKAKGADGQPKPKPKPAAAKPKGSPAAAKKAPKTEAAPAPVVEEGAEAPMEEDAPEEEAASPREAKDVSALAAYVGRRVKVYWKKEKAWYEGEVMHFDGKRLHRIKYDDGEDDWVNLDKRKWDFAKEKSAARRRKRVIDSD
eukprot:CAMPEP_0182871404 /NCGR_PEP_ID=MMETSP0034_2-20130328/11105_1 /TAXON_ID=156128 /ORGANISM="Nephroselmis pyriformis, Strain CCMP717" /LENGTH=191 /DNA_ID=CAMNT_0025003955 /DNA_START=27 /DNA_END=599 /DNA_ORIENTATION=-